MPTKHRNGRTRLVLGVIGLAIATIGVATTVTLAAVRDRNRIEHRVTQNETTIKHVGATLAEIKTDADVIKADVKTLLQRRP